MEKTTYQIGNRTLTGCCWMPEPHQSPVGVVVILHGMSEHILRYQTFAEQLAKAGYLVHGYNQRGLGLWMTNLAGTWAKMDSNS